MRADMKNAIRAHQLSPKSCSSLNPAYCSGYEKRRRKDDYSGSNSQNLVHFENVWTFRRRTSLSFRRQMFLLDTLDRVLG